MRIFVVGMTGVALLSTAAAALAADPVPDGRFELVESFALGIADHELDPHTRVTGWRLNQSWYVGREKGEDALALVWQGRRQQVSISTEEIRFTRRFQ